jgi:hypothetical protein
MEAEAMTTAQEIRMAGYAFLVCSVASDSHFYSGIWLLFCVMTFAVGYFGTRIRWLRS